MTRLQRRAERFEALRAERRRLEEQIREESFDAALSRRLDVVLVALEKAVRER